jgi:hypothetical protein
VVRVREEAESVVVRGFVKGFVKGFVSSVISVISVSSRSSSRVILDKVYKGCRRCMKKYIWSVGGVGYPPNFYFPPPNGTLGGTLHPLHLFYFIFFFFKNNNNK